MTVTCQVLVDTDATLDEAPLLARRIAAMLARRGVIAGGPAADHRPALRTRVRA